MITKSGLDIIFREAEKSDAQNLIDYMNTVGGESDNLTFGAGGLTMTVEQEVEFIDAARENKFSSMIIGLIDDEITSVGFVNSQPKERFKHIAHLAISVKKKYWNDGVATLLMAELINFAKTNGQTEILHLGVKAENTHAIKLYKKFGFEESGYHKNFFKINGEYFDEILMDLHL